MATRVLSLFLALMMVFSVTVPAFAEGMEQGAEEVIEETVQTPEAEEIPEPEEAPEQKDEPAAEPVPEPKEEPADQPVPEEKEEPVDEPSPEATAEPTAEPTSEPTSEPTAEPEEDEDPDAITDFPAYAMTVELKDDEFIVLLKKPGERPANIDSLPIITEPTPLKLTSSAYDEDGELWYYACNMNTDEKGYIEASMIRQVSAREAADAVTKPEPTVEPSDEPSAEPTEEPSEEPTEEPVDPPVAEATPSEATPGEATPGEATAGEADKVAPINAIMPIWLTGADLQESLANVLAAGEYQQDKARSMISQINGLRTGSNAWYWNSDNSTKTVLTNLKSLAYDSNLEQIAMQRAIEIVLNYDHTRPDGSSCFTLEYNGVRSYGENIARARGYTQSEIFEMWAEADQPYSGQGHRRNMLDPNFTSVGIASFIIDGVEYWVQEFGYMPSITSLDFDGDNLTISWNSGYTSDRCRLYYKVGGGKWIPLTDSAGSSYTWADAEVGQTYTFTVRAINSSGTAIGSYDTVGKTITCVATPKAPKVENVANGVKITWDKVANAVKYRVFYKVGDGKWTAAGDTTSTSFLWEEAKSGQTYTIAVRCVNSIGDSYTSGIDETGSTIMYVAPPVVSVANEIGGVKVTWDKVPGAVNYRVFYKTGSGNWTRLAETTENSYLWEEAKNGQTYSFTVRCLNAEGTAYVSAYDTVGVSTTYYAPPALTLTSVNEGIDVRWDSIPGVTNYMIYYQVNNGPWTAIGSTTGTSYTFTGAVSGRTYAFSVRCLTDDGGAFLSGFDTVGTSIVFVAPPTVSVANEIDGVKISWDKVAGAVNYRVYYRTGNGNWIKLDDTTETSYLWTEAKNGEMYAFTVRCVNEDGSEYTSGYDTVGKTITFYEPPKLTVTAANNGINVSWSRTEGVNNYRVYYKIGNGSWMAIGNTVNTAYTFKKVESGQTYFFSVRCLSDDGKEFLSGFDTVGKSATFIAAPVVSVSSEIDGVKITWSKVPGAVNYRVFYRVGNEGWTRITDTTATSLIWTGASNGEKYAFTVRCINADGSAYTSGYDTVGRTITHYAPPRISLSCVNGGIDVSWSKVSGVTNYRVYYKVGDGAWAAIGNTANNKYTFKKAESGKKYAFSVRCLTADGKEFLSGFDTVGESITYIEAPKVSVANATDGVKITWDKVAGATNYRVFYKTGSGSWARLIDTSSTSYIWTGAKSGTKYAFTVRCLSSDGSAYTSGYDTVGKSIVANCAAPTVSINAGNDGISVSWNKVAGAAKYKVYYRVGNGSWITIGYTAANSYTFKNAVPGQTYAFTVKCTDSANNPISGYISSNSIQYAAKPVVSKVEKVSSGVKISWDKVDGAVKYRVYYRTGGGSWTRIEDTSATSFVWDGAMKGNTYAFTVRCVTSDGTHYASGYDTAGKSIAY